MSHGTLLAKADALILHFCAVSKLQKSRQILTLSPPCKSPIHVSPVLNGRESSGGKCGLHNWPTAVITAAGHLSNMGNPHIPCVASQAVISSRSISLHSSRKIAHRSRVLNFHTSSFPGFGIAAVPGRDPEGSSAMDAFDKPPDEVFPVLLQGAVPLPRGLCSVLRPLLISIAGLDTLSGGLKPANAGSATQYLRHYLNKQEGQEKNMHVLAALAQHVRLGGQVPGA